MERHDRRRGSAAPGPDGAFEFVDDDARFAEILTHLAGVSEFAIDTEFHRERTYFPQLALVQLAWDDVPGGPSAVAIIDPLAVDIGALRDVLERDITTVVHAADQDLEVLELACGVLPRRMYDTQVAAGFLGMSTPSLAALHDRELGLHLSKGDRLTDWLRRPLDAEQLSYAASDVAHLLRVRERQLAELDKRGRTTWAEDECEINRLRARGQRDPQEVWRKVKEVRQLRGKALAVGQAVAAWREERAAALDVPVRHVFPDLAIVAVSQRPPRSLDDLKKVRSVDGRFLRDGAGNDLLAVIRDAQQHAPRPSEDHRADLERELRPALGLVSAWVSQLARNLDIDTAILANRGDLEALLRGDPEARLAHGWRAGLVGEPVRKLVAGEAALAFDPDGELVLEGRSRLAP